MISARTAKFIEILPNGMINFIAKKLLNRYLRKYANINVQGMEKIKDIEKPIIFICNHLSNADGLVLNEVLKKHDPTFVAGVKLSKNVLTNLGIHIVKTTTVIPNTADKEGISKIIKILKNKENILIFPEGTRSRKGKMIKAKRGLLLIAKMSRATIVPIGINGTEVLLPINDCGMEKENFNHANVNIKIGEPFKISKKNRNEDRKEYEARAVDECMYRIAELLPQKYRGVYGDKNI